jgi:2-succinyl-5-enolpyruvyl-6-hydroxy-3-cyclohexene-1-carboxylate synthase
VIPCWLSGANTTRISSSPITKTGIDGLVSAAIGAALAHQDRGGGAAAALLGDLAFLHKPNGLVLGPDEPRPDLAIVVVNNHGPGS